MRFTSRSDPESRSGRGVSSSITSTCRRPRWSSAGEGRLPGAGCAASAPPHFAANTAWLRACAAFGPLARSVPAVAPSSCTTTAAGWYSVRKPAARTANARSVSS